LELDERLDCVVHLARYAGDFALGRFRASDSLVIESRAHRNLVFVVEEHGRPRGRCGFDWVIDPIDGTTVRFRGIPH
jgi:fructose-1,6-bisphosphatase/inositol monophosphatase family enzyme